MSSFEKKEKQRPSGEDDGAAEQLQRELELFAQDDDDEEASLVNT